MANYTPSVDFAAKDDLTKGDPNKIVKGSELSSEFSSVQSAVNSKADASSPTLTGTGTAVNLTVSGTLNANGTLQVGGVAITATAVELNLLDGVTASTSELNLLDGVTATTEEINYLDGVTDPVQGQLDAKAETKADIGLGNVDNVSASDLRNRSTHTGTQPLSTISDAGTAAAEDVSAFATSAQGDLADTALQDGDTVSSLDIDGGTIDGTVIGGSSAAAGTFTSITGDAVTQSATDTTAGRLLKVGDFGLGGNATITSDYDSEITPGLYTNTTGTASAPTPVAAWTVLVVRSTPARISQLASRAFGGTDKGVYTRNTEDGGTTWSPWLKHYHSTNLLGTVSESAGVPTGAVIERGSNANGEYVKFADGTMICTRTTVLSSLSVPSNGNTSLGLFSLPASFVSRPDYVAAEFVDAASNAYKTTPENPSSVRFANVLTIRNLDGTARSLSGDLKLFATGRWF